MRGHEVLAVLDLIAAEGITAWVDGGWGVDALLGVQTRDHADLDLVVDAKKIDRLIELLRNEGFGVGRDWRPTAIAFRHPDGREVDLHPVELTADGGGDQIQLDGVTRWHYDAPTTGRIDGRTLLCCPAETQLRAHLGYEPDENDVADVRALTDRFGLELPEPYHGPE